MASPIDNPPEAPIAAFRNDRINTGSLGSRWLSRIFGGVVNLVVFAMLGAILYFGHHNGWTIPKFGGAVASEADDWCPEHFVPESECVECNAELLPKPESFGFCAKHGVAECVIDHSELAQVRGEPRLPRYDTAAAIGLIRRPGNDRQNMLHQNRVQFASHESALRAGIEVDEVQERPMADFLTANGELVFNPTRVAHLSARVAGTVAVVFKTVGDDVRAGDALALVDAAPVGHAKSQLLQAIVQVQLKRKNVERLRSAAAAVQGKTVLEAEAAVQEAEIAFLSARQALVNLGFELPDDLEERDAVAVSADLQLLGITPSQVDSLPAGTRTANLIPVRATYDGVVVASEVVAGEVVDATRLLFTIADPRQMWLTLNVRQEDARYVVRGLPVTFETDDGVHQTSGKISWLSPSVDERTRTLRVRVPLDNPDCELRDRTFGTGRIILREEPLAVVVPKEAVQSAEGTRFVFVRDKDYLKDGSLKVFHVRQVRLGARDDSYVELLAGALPGEVVATKGSAVILAQLLRGKLGADECGE